MADITSLYQQADWKKEKHVPVIDCPDTVKSGEAVAINVTIGKEIPHPNTTEHHIVWIELFFKPDDDKFAYSLGRFELAAHGASVAGANQGPAYTEPHVSVVVKLVKSGTLLATSWCNIHGLWQDSRPVKVT